MDGQPEARVDAQPGASVTAGPAATSRSRFVRAARGEAVDRAPVWFMRQAGRSLPEYRALRAGTAMLDACRDPDLVTEITLQPVRRHAVDAAILFSDIVVPLVAAGVDIEIVPGVGPVVAKPVRTLADVEAIKAITCADVEFVATAVGQLVAELGATPLIGFAGAPFTLASYLIEGGPSREHALTKAMMHGEPELWRRLLARLATITAEFLRTQIAAGASAVQLFDSWAGALSAADYENHVLPHSRSVFDALGEGTVPKIHFGVGTGEFLHLMRAAGADVVGVDWRVPLSEAAHRMGPGAIVQGNLDPALLLAPWPVIEDEVRRILADGRRAVAEFGAAAHIFNLGHGVLPDTDPEVLSRVVELVHASQQ
ncbi:MAG: uroporphyrinogen decarboxylase [Actinobacteria bacterium]|nr:uroporphyrinogen decarboxylase [Actinomycetota bacterium]